MHTFYYADHSRHDPGKFNKAGNADVPSFLDVPARIKVVRGAILKAAIGPVISPGDFGIEPIGEVHDYGMINLLQTGYRLLRDSNLSPPFLPDTFATRITPSHMPRSTAGLFGYYAFDKNTPILEHTWQVAYWSAQTAISASALILAGSDRVAYALCRPPGHHASASLFGGYCYLNNAAIAANWLVQQGQRVAILDIDYHHGNGTQGIFYHRSDVLVCSLHADPFREYPYYWGYADEYGEGAGRNYNFNFPLPRNIEEVDYLRTLEQALVKIQLFVPDVLIVSVGFDVIEGDAAGSFSLQRESMHRVGARLRKLELPLVVVQEGGYRLLALGETAAAFFRGVTGAK